MSNQESKLSGQNRQPLSKAALDDFYTKKERETKNEMLEREVEQRHVWFAILHAYLADWYMDNMTNPPDLYLRIDVGDESLIAWPLYVDGSGVRYCLTDDNEIVVTWYERYQFVSDTPKPLEELDTELLGDLLDAALDRGIVPKEYEPFRKSAWYRYGNDHQRKFIALP